jgi:hypothetical protein
VLNGSLNFSPQRRGGKEGAKKGIFLRRLGVCGWYLGLQVDLDLAAEEVFEGFAFANQFSLSVNDEDFCRAWA